VDEANRPSPAVPACQSQSSGTYPKPMCGPLGTISLPPAELSAATFELCSLRKRKRSEQRAARLEHYRTLGAGIPIQGGATRVTGGHPFGPLRHETSLKQQGNRGIQPALRPRAISPDSLATLTALRRATGTPPEAVRSSPVLGVVADPGVSSSGRRSTTVSRARRPRRRSPASGRLPWRSAARQAPSRPARPRRTPTPAAASPGKGIDFRDALEGLAYGLGIGMLPAAALAVLAGRVRARRVLVAAALAVFGTDIATSAVAQASPSSTAGVALILAPLLELVTVIPATILLCRLTSAERDG
jgi:hypothetical protein